MKYHGTILAPLGYALQLDNFGMRRAPIGSGVAASSAAARADVVFLEKRYGS
jgi:hypothetical protein